MKQISVIKKSNHSNLRGKHLLKVNKCRRRRMDSSRLFSKVQSYGITFQITLRKQSFYNGSVPALCWKRGRRPATLLRKRFWHRCFLVNLAKFQRTPFLTENLRWLLLKIGTTVSQTVSIHQHHLKFLVIEVFKSTSYLNSQFQIENL